MTSPGDVLKRDLLNICCAKRCSFRIACRKFSFSIWLHHLTLYESIITNDRIGFTNEPAICWKRTFTPFVLFDDESRHVVSGLHPASHLFLIIKITREKNSILATGTQSLMWEHLTRLQWYWTLLKFSTHECLELERLEFANNLRYRILKQSEFW